MMRADRQAGIITILQLLLGVVLVWGFSTYAPRRYLPAFNLPVLSDSQGVDAQVYFTRVLQGIENSRKTMPGRELPVAQSCATLTPYRPDSSKVAGCHYQPSVVKAFTS